ncbi:MAG: hypothetical protein H7125_12940 [Proteobacteria bacterium]|nr:hypothetical protein [Burkholderiales bacterium]
MKQATILKLAAIAGALALSATQAVAATIDWTNWTSNTAGTISGGVSVTHTGPSSLLLGFPSWTPTSTWADGVLIGNAPPASGNMLATTGGTNTVNSIVFSQPITNPVFAIWSLGQPGVTATFDFINATPTFVAGGPNAEFGGVAFTVAGQSAFGQEANGSLVFGGTFTSISWTNPLFENYYGFTVGINGGTPGTPVIPVPAAAWLLGSGLMGLLAFSRRRKVAA